MKPFLNAGLYRICQVRLGGGEFLSSINKKSRNRLKMIMKGDHEDQAYKLLMDRLYSIKVPT